MTLMEALRQGITKVTLPEWKSGQYMEIELEETERGPRINPVGILYTPGDLVRRPIFDDKDRVIGSKVVPSEKRKVDAKAYMWASRYEAYEAPVYVKEPKTKN